jgi:hypothetical protein
VPACSRRSKYCPAFLPSWVKFQMAMDAKSTQLGTSSHPWAQFAGGADGVERQNNFVSSKIARAHTPCPSSSRQPHDHNFQQLHALQLVASLIT